MSGDGHFALTVDLGEVAEVLRPHVVELLHRLGPPAELIDDPLAALTASSTDPAERPQDPVLARLLPDGVVGDDAAAREFRRFSHDTLRERKRRDAQFLLGLIDGGDATLDRGEALQLMGAFNDLRLMLGTELAVTEDAEVEDAEVEEESEGDVETEKRSRAVFALLSWLQEDLVAAVASTGGGTA